MCQVCLTREFKIIKTIIDTFCGDYMKCPYFLPATVRA